MDKTGVGIKFPISLKNGSVELVSGVKLIEQSMFDILLSNKPRFFLGEYKSRMEELFFEPNDQVLLSLLNLFIFEALNAWEKRTQVLEIKFSIQEARIDCSIYHRLIGDTQVSSFVFPFYKNLVY